jgi:hypothetical protein
LSKKGLVLAQRTELRTIFVFLSTILNHLTMALLLIISFGLCFFLTLRLIKASQKKGLNHSNSYEEYVRDRRDARRRARANAKASESEKNTEGGKIE